MVILNDDSRRESVFVETVAGNRSSYDIGKVFADEEKAIEWFTGARLAQCNPEDLAKAVLAVKSNPELAQELSAASRQRWEQFKW